MAGRLGETEKEGRTVTVTVRVAAPDDAEAIWDVKRASWLATYPDASLGITLAQVRQRLDGTHGERVAPGIARIREHIAAGGTRAQYIVAEESGVITGMTAPLIEDSGRHRVGSLYLRPDVTGRGIGRHLLACNLAWHGRGPDVCLYVAAYNQRAIRFYSRHGFTLTDEEVPGKLDVFVIPARIMIRRGTA